MADKRAPPPSLPRPPAPNHLLPTSGQNPSSSPLAATRQLTLGLQTLVPGSDASSSDLAPKCADEAIRIENLESQSDSLSSEDGAVGANSMLADELQRLKEELQRVCKEKQSLQIALGKRPASMVDGPMLASSADKVFDEMSHRNIEADKVSDGKPQGKNANPAAGNKAVGETSTKGQIVVLDGDDREGVGKSLKNDQFPPLRRNGTKGSKSGNVGKEWRPRNAEQDKNIKNMPNKSAVSKPAMTWAQRTAASVIPSRSLKLDYFEAIEKSDDKVLIDACMENLDPDSYWSQCLAGYFLGRRPHFQMVEAFALKYWEGVDEVTLYDGMFLFHFPNAEDRLKILKIGNWMFGNQPMLLQQWDPELQLKSKSLVKIQLWVKILDIPIAMWNEGGLSRLASGIGKPLYCDAVTEKLKGAEFARICVEIDTGHKLPDIVNVKYFDHVIPCRVEYHWRPLQCHKCKVFGHDCNKIRTNDVQNRNQAKPASNVPAKTVTSGNDGKAAHVKAFTAAVPPEHIKSHVQTRHEAVEEPLLQSLIPEVNAENNHNIAGNINNSVAFIAGNINNSVEIGNTVGNGSVGPNGDGLGADESMESNGPAPISVESSEKSGTSDPPSHISNTPQEQEKEFTPPHPKRTARKKKKKPGDDDPEVNETANSFDNLEKEEEFVNEHATVGKKKASKNAVGNGKVVPPSSKGGRRNRRCSPPTFAVYISMIFAWNVRGLCTFARQNEVKSRARKLGATLVILNETRVKEHKFTSIANNTFPKWKVLANYRHIQDGRIWVAWNPEILEFQLVDMNAQAIHGKITIKDNGKNFFISAIYGNSMPVPRETLWKDLVDRSSSFHPVPWCVLGDFNAILSKADKVGGVDEWDTHDNHLRDCMIDAGLFDLHYVGLRHTWDNKSTGDRSLIEKLDRVLVNIDWVSTFPTSKARFLHFGGSDHAPSWTTLGLAKEKRCIPFKFFSMWTSHPSYADTVKEAWNYNSGSTHCPMFILVQKLKKVKFALKNLNAAWYSDISGRVADSEKKLEQIQILLHADRGNIQLRADERSALCELNKLRNDEEIFYKQKARIQWLKDGDRNTKFFHAYVKDRQNKKRITSIVDDTGNILTDPNDVKQHFIDYFRELLAAKETMSSSVHLDNSMIARISETEATSMADAVTDKEIKATMFSLAGNKAPGPDGFPVEFYKASWDVVGRDVTNAIKDFFASGRILKEINSTIIALVPKCDNPLEVGDFRPISCCNTIYKCISKIIVNRLKGCLNEIISSNQMAFVHGRRITDNILLAQELFKNYHIGLYTARCAMKVDIRKAYDTISWKFIIDALRAMGFHEKMIGWINACMSTAKFSVCINGELNGYFENGRGIRQGDPLSPYLFIIAMEVFTAMLNKATLNDFSFHWRCKKLRLVHLLFADDILLFCEGKSKSVDVIHNTLDGFASISGLEVNKAKSAVFFSGGENVFKSETLRKLGFAEGELPFKYLGVPISGNMVSSADCLELINRITARAKSWTTRLLSFAGRLQLVKTILYSIQVYWASIFILPKAVLKSMTKIIRAFLWKGPSLDKGGAKVSWHDICMPKNEGGLGLRDLEQWNTALFMKHAWYLLVDSESLWCKWIHSELLNNNKNFWTVKYGFASWTWSQILEMREIIKERVRWKIHDGKSIYLWFDNWNAVGPLWQFLGLNAATSLNAKLSSVISNGVWDLSRRLDTQAIRDRLPPLLQNMDCDKLEWIPGKLGIFSTSSAWQSIRNRAPIVDWYSFVWFKNHTPRHAFLTWIAIKDRLGTQDRLLRITRINPRQAKCALCKREADSVNHLFFQCTMTRKLFDFWLNKCGLTSQLDNWKEIVDWAANLFRGNSYVSVMSKISLQGLIYSIWIERNNILFRGAKVTRIGIQLSLCKIVADKDSILSLDATSNLAVHFRERWGLAPMPD